VAYHCFLHNKMKFCQFGSPCMQEAVAYHCFQGQPAPSAAVLFGEPPARTPHCTREIKSCRPLLHFHSAGGSSVPLFPGPAGARHGGAAGRAAGRGGRAARSGAARRDGRPVARRRRRRERRRQRQRFRCAARFEFAVEAETLHWAGPRKRLIPRPLECGSSCLHAETSCVNGCRGCGLRRRPAAARQQWRRQRRWQWQRQQQQRRRWQPDARQQAAAHGAGAVSKRRRCVHR